jgi:hypothetical protein
MKISSKKNIPDIQKRLASVETATHFRAPGNFEREAVRLSSPSNEEIGEMLWIARGDHATVERIYGLLERIGGREDIEHITRSLLNEKNAETFESGVIALQQIGGPRAAAALDGLLGLNKDNEEACRVVRRSMQAILNTSSPCHSFGEPSFKVGGAGKYQVHLCEAQHFGTDISGDVARDSYPFVEAAVLARFEELQQKLAVRLNSEE